jgi:predicted short-subunit dehydrogenase-like oxidoreductase (DUF2520 family)
VLSRTLTSARRAVREMDIGAVAAGAEDLASCQVVLVSVPDSALGAVAAQLAAARLDWAKKIVLHTSGMWPGAALARLRKKGAAVGSMHPLYIFQRPLPQLAGVYFTVEGDHAANAMARRLIRAWGGEFLLVKPEHKIHHSIAKSMASDFLTGLVEAAVQQMAAGGFSRKRSFDAVSKVIGAALEDYSLSGRNSRPGPLLNGDAKTVEQQIIQLKSVDRSFSVAYLSGVRQTLRTLGRETKEFPFLRDRSSSREDRSP